MGNCASAKAYQPGCVSTPSRRLTKRSWQAAQSNSGMGLDALVQAGIAEAQMAFKARSKREKGRHIKKATGMLNEAYQRSSALGDHHLNVHLTAVLLKLAEAQGRVLGASLGSLELDSAVLQAQSSRFGYPLPLVEESNETHADDWDAHGSSASASQPKASLEESSELESEAGGRPRAGYEVLQDGATNSEASSDVPVQTSSSTISAAAGSLTTVQEHGGDDAGGDDGGWRQLEDADQGDGRPSPQAGAEQAGGRRALGRLLENLGLAGGSETTEDGQSSPQHSPAGNAEATADEAGRLSRWWSRMGLGGSAEAAGPEAVRADGTIVVDSSQSNGNEDAVDTAAVPCEAAATAATAPSSASPQTASVFARAFGSPAVRSATVDSSVPATGAAPAGGRAPTGSTPQLAPATPSQVVALALRPPPRTPSSSSNAPLQPSPTLPASQAAEWNPTDNYVSLDTREQLEKLSKDDFSVLRDWSMSKKRQRSYGSFQDSVGSDSDSPQKSGLHHRNARQEYVRNPLEECDLMSNLSGGTQNLDTLSVCNSAAPSVTPSVAPSPFAAHLAPRQDVTPLVSPVPNPDELLVKVLSGVSGEEEARFCMNAQAAQSPEHFLRILDRLCQHHAGQSLSGLQWLTHAEGSHQQRFERRECNMRMVEELFGSQGPEQQGLQLLLCTVPVTPPSELSASKVRLKAVSPSTVTSAAAAIPTKVRVETIRALEANHEYSVAFTCQWSNKTYAVEAAVLPNKKGVVATVPWQMLSKEGLYDVHLVFDGKFRSENRKTFNVGSPESDTTTCTEVSARPSGRVSAFVPLGATASPPQLVAGQASTVSQDVAPAETTPPQPAASPVRWRPLRRRSEGEAEARQTASAPNGVLSGTHAAGSSPQAPAAPAVAVAAAPAAAAAPVSPATASAAPARAAPAIAAPAAAPPVAGATPVVAAASPAPAAVTGAAATAAPSAAPAQAEASESDLVPSPQCGLGTVCNSVGFLPEPRTAAAQ